MWILPLVGYVGLVLGFAFLVLAIASGLYYLSEVVEEHTVIAKKLLTRMIYAVIVTQSLLWLFDGFPAILSITILVLLNHYLWFRHFSASPSYSPSSSRHPYSRYPYEESPYDLMPSFTEIASFFGLCVWLVPFSLFVSLSAAENVLPSMGSEYATGEGSSYTRPGQEPTLNSAFNQGRGRQGMAKAIVDRVRGWATETGELMGLSQSDRVKRRF